MYTGDPQNNRLRSPKMLSINLIFVDILCLRRTLDFMNQVFHSPLSITFAHYCVLRKMSDENTLYNKQLDPWVSDHIYDCSFVVQNLNDSVRVYLTFPCTITVIYHS